MLSVIPVTINRNNMANLNTLLKWREGSGVHLNARDQPLIRPNAGVGTRIS